MDPARQSLLLEVMQHLRLEKCQLLVAPSSLRGAPGPWRGEVLGVSGHFQRPANFACCSQSSANQRFERHAFTCQNAFTFAPCSLLAAPWCGVTLMDPARQSLLLEVMQRLRL